MTPDPIGLEGGDVNLYSYVGGDPINWYDSTGLMKLPDNPGGLGGEWTRDPRHKNPKNPGEEKYTDSSGRDLYWHPGRPEHPSKKQKKDHWHDPENYPNGKHLHPGDEVPDPAPVPDDAEFSMPECGETCQKIITGIGQAGIILFMIICSPTGASS